jgi:6-phosphogluconolactonase
LRALAAAGFIRRPLSHARTQKTPHAANKEEFMLRSTRNLTALAVAVGALVAVSPLSAQRPQPETVFVMTNDANKNEVISYQASSNGEFYEANRFGTEGRGSGGTVDPLSSQGSLTLSPDHSVLYAVNAGSGTVSVFSNYRGWLTLVDKIDAGGSQPVATTQWQNVVYVLSSGGSGSIVAFRYGWDGRLHEIPNSTVYLSNSRVSGASITVSPDGKVLVATEIISGKIDIFPINADGTLGTGTFLASPGPGVFSARFAPEGVLIVSETGATGATNGSAISSYTVSAGALTPVTQSLPTLGAANCWNAITPNGKWVYASNAGSSTISGFSIGATGALTAVGSTIVAGNPAGATNLDVTVSSDGKYLFSLNTGNGTVGVFAIQQDGTLVNAGAIEGLPVTAGLNGIAAL